MIMAKVRGHFKGEQNLTGLEAIQRDVEITQKANAEMAAGRSDFHKKVTGYPPTQTDMIVLEGAKTQAHAKDMSSFLIGLGRVIQGDV
jgi:hypothetical protein